MPPVFGFVPSNRTLRALGADPCQHPAEKLRAGPRITHRWGTGPTEICECGVWRSTLHAPGPWRGSQMPIDDET